MGTPDFVHLTTHSTYSLLEGAMQLDQILDIAKKDEQPAIAITDSGNLFVALEFSEKAYKLGIQPIIGCKLKVDFGDQADSMKGSDGFSELVLLAANQAGAGNLIEIVSRTYTETDASKFPHATYNLLSNCNEGLIVLTGGVDGSLGQPLFHNRRDLALSRLKQLEKLYGDQLYIELQRHDTTAETQIEGELIEIAYEAGIPLVASNESYFCAQQDFEAQDALVCIAEGCTIAEKNRKQFTKEHYFKSRKEMCQLFADIPEALENTVEIAKRCHVKLTTRDPILPSFASIESDPEQAVKAESDELRKQAREGLEARFNDFGMADGVTREEYEERLEFELNVIEEMKYPGYFLIVADIIKWAKSQLIPVGPGRGSGAGSLVAYSLTITDLDPLRFGLLFERFLNPERVSMPDFDIDFCQDRREEVIRYVQKKFGEDQVAQIITFGTLQARAVIRDVGRVLQMPHGQVDRLAKLVPSMPLGITLKQALKDEPRFEEERSKSEVVDKLLNISLKLEGLNRHAGTHAAGVVIGDRPLEKLVPIYRDPKSDLPVTQFNMKWVEQAGLVKFDFLGLKTLTVIDNSIKLIKQNSPDVEIDISKLPLDDKKTYDLIARGETVGVFQLESAGMRRAIAGMKPDRFEDIIALVALYRPGPMDNIPLYNDVKHERKKPDYLHPKLEPVLQETYGIIVYQEQVMELAQVLAGYSLGGADLLRRAMGKKIKQEMDAQKDVFIEGAKENEVSSIHAKEIFDKVAKFADYGFNKSHAAAYALVAYQTAWLKANYPVEFLAASMTLEISNVDKLHMLRQEARHMGIEVEPPSINKSDSYFQAIEGKIVYAMSAVKGVSRILTDHFVSLRKEEPFKNVSDFARRIDAKQTSKKQLEYLVSAGAFDEFDQNRARMFNSIDHILKESLRTSENQLTGQADFFGNDAEAEPLVLKEVDPWSRGEQLKNEHVSIGFYLSSHPIDDYKLLFDKLRVQYWDKFIESVKNSEKKSGRLIGIIDSRSERTTKSGNKMGIIKLSDPSGQYEAIMWSETLIKYRPLLEVGAQVILTVGAEMRDEDVSLIVNQVELLEKVANDLGKSMEIFVRDTQPIKYLQKHINQQSKKGQGEINFVVVREKAQDEIVVKLADKYSITPQFAGALKSIPGVIDVQLH